MTFRLAPGLGVELAYEERGSGPALLLIHGTALTRASWHGTIEALGPGVRAIAYDRRGYGGSGAPEDYAGTTIEEQAEDAAALIEALGAGPVVACGHSAGAVVALDLLLRHPARVRAAVVIEPPLLSLSPAGAEALGELRERMEEAARTGGAEAVASAYLEAHGGGGSSAPARAVLADLGAVSGWELGRRRLRAIEAPLLVLRGSRSTAVQREVAAALADMVGAARLRDVEAGHLVPLEAPVEVAAAVRELL